MGQQNAWPKLKPGSAAALLTPSTLSWAGLHSQARGGFASLSLGAGCVPTHETLAQGV